MFIGNCPIAVGDLLEMWSVVLRPVLRRKILRALDQFNKWLNGFMYIRAQIIGPDNPTC